MDHVLSVMQKRRSRYGLDKRSPVPDGAVTELVRQAVLHTPSAFNMQSGRAVVLLGAEHTRLWQITLEALRPQVPAEKLPATEKKLASFEAGYGTVLFFDDMETVGAYARQYALYGDNFPIWAQQANGMLQLAVWLLLEEAGLGASLQHYNPLIDEPVRDTWGLPAAWKLIAQMPFGAPVAEPGPKESLPIQQRVKAFG